MQDSTASRTPLTWQDTAFFRPVGKPVDTVPPAASIFEGHLLRPVAPALTPAPIPEAGSWAFPVLILCIGLMAAASVKGGFRPAALLRAALDRSAMSTVLRSGVLSDGLWPRVAMAASLVSLSMFLTVMLNGQGLPVGTGPGETATVLFGVSILLVADRWAGAALGSVMNVHQLFTAHIVEREVLIISAGMALLPVTLMMLYGPEAVSPIAGGLGVVFVILCASRDLQRSVGLLWGGQGVRAWHIFYYFCALKLLPLSVAFRAISAH